MSIGLTFGNLKVVDEFIYERSGTRTWVCECKCGRRVNRQPSDLRNGKYTKGCYSCVRGVDLTGKVFGDLTVDSLSKKTRGGTYWNTTCKCGSSYEISTSHLKQLKDPSCGTCNKARRGAWNITHGGTKGEKNGAGRNRIYYCWKAMHERCSNAKSKVYRWYGAKGISVCSDWSDYTVFEAWALENGFEPNLTIERIDPIKDYEPSNCEWISQSENTLRMLAYHKANKTGIFAKC